MLPLHAHGYRSGLSASPGFRQIRHTSSSSSSSSATSNLDKLLCTSSLFADTPIDAEEYDADEVEASGGSADDDEAAPPSEEVETSMPS